MLPRHEGGLRHSAFEQLPEFVHPGDLLVVNRSRVFPARLLGARPKGGEAEVLLLRPLEDPQDWEAFLRPARRMRIGDRIRVAEDLSVLVQSDALGAEGRRRIRLETPEDPWRAIEHHGHVPLPPYVSRPDRPADRERYQTVYAREPGSVAAPTAGLHFTPQLFERLRAGGVEIAEVVLHVGPGTFRPVQVEHVEDHRVDPEPFDLPEITAEAIGRARSRGGRVIAVGTTTVRTLESRADAGGGVRPGRGETDCVIVPGFRFRVIDGLVTNFHLPRSSLLLLVAAFAGRERALSAYAEAIRERYRFYSYGDAMLIV